MKTWLWGDNSISIQGRIIVLAYSLPSHSYLTLNQVHFNPFCTFKDIWPGQASIMKNKWLWGDNSVNIQSRIVVHDHRPSPHCHLSIYKFDLNANRSFKVLCWTRCRTDGQTKGRLYVSPFGEHKNAISFHKICAVKLLAFIGVNSFTKKTNSKKLYECVFIVT